MRIPVFAGLRQTARWLTSHLRPPALILLYHRVTKLPSDPWGLAVSPRHFAEQLEVLRRHYHSMRLSELCHALANGRLPRRALAITFDDGYADNLYNAKPLLERNDLPATVFLPSGLIGQAREFWWDELDRLLLQPGVLPGTLRLHINGRTYAWEPGAAANYSEHEAQRYRHWRAWEAAPGPRHGLYRALWELLHPLPPGEQCRVLDTLVAWAKAEPICRPTHRLLVEKEVLALARDGLIDIGAHTVTHPALRSLSVDAQRKEIQQGKTQLETMLERPVTTFAYPYGKQRDYTAETVALIREAAFTCACTNIAGAVTSATDPFQLPRLFVGDWNGEQFAEQLAQVLP